MAETTTAAPTTSDAFRRVREFASNIDLVITETNHDEELIVVEDPERSITNMVIDCEDPILEIQQLIMRVPEGADAATLFRRLLQMNGLLVHGAFVLGEDGMQIVFRDTLRLDTLDQTELEGTINALELGLAEFGDELIELRRTLD